jgi:hypothetical protein
MLNETHHVHWSWTYVPADRKCLINYQERFHYHTLKHIFPNSSTIESGKTWMMQREIYLLAWSTKDTLEWSRESTAYSISKAINAFADFRPHRLQKLEYINNNSEWMKERKRQILNMNVSILTNRICSQHEWMNEFS